MRRFRLTGPEVLIGGTSFQRLSQTILVSEGKVAVLADDDPRGDDLARSPYLEEVDENGTVIARPVDADNPPVSENETVETLVDETGGPAEAGDTGEEEKHEKSRTRKPPADSGGV